MKEQLCQAFCDEIEVHSVPIGLAVSTGFNGFTGDPIGFYVSGPDEHGRFRIQDDGMTVFNLETAGADLEIATRAAAFESLLREYGFSYNNNEHILISPPLDAADIASRALRFVALLLRLQDLLLMVQEHAASTFKEEVVRMLRQSIGAKAEVLENEPISAKFADYPADVLMRAQSRPPVALYFATTDAKLSEAVIVEMLARYEAKVDCSVIAMVESEQSTITRKARQRAANRLTAVSYFRGDEEAAIARVVREVTGERVH
jgi:hypothetical protein